ncbi:hypothetical protein K2173_007836 [Erythroxylum novogranatense]|uniref:E3 ubiquitin-protein ligase LIN-1 n=1 Tax=Erythroxylum novogranatense TaxID=1862640 RepID=A0AAV8TLD9_9ROSI|nr:hypothetical protein K2173_007836 [Erythroxylum novogranatense]
MASVSSCSFSVLSQDDDRPGLQSIRILVFSINECILEFLANTDSWKSLKLQCTSRLHIQKQEFFEFFEHSVLSNLYWGIENIEAALHAKCPGEKSTLLRDSERMLQVPALLDEQGVTAGISNHYLVCLAYFYLSVVKKLQNDEWQVALHFLQAMLVSPRVLQKEFLLKFGRSFFYSSIMPQVEVINEQKGLSDDPLADSSEDSIDEAVKEIAGRHKQWLMYYQVISYGELPKGNNRNINSSSLEDESRCFSHVVTSTNDDYNSTEQGHLFQNFYSNDKVHPLDPHGHILECLPNEPKKTEYEEYLSIKCLHEVLLDTESDTPTSSSSHHDCSLKDSDLEGTNEYIKTSTRRARESDNKLQPEVCAQNLQAPCSSLSTRSTKMILPHSRQHQVQDVDITDLFSGRFVNSVGDLDLSLSKHRYHTKENCLLEENSVEKLSQREVLNQTSSTNLQSYKFSLVSQQKISPTKQQISHKSRNFNESFDISGKDSKMGLVGVLEKAISKLFFSDGLVKCEEDYAVQVTTIYEMLNKKRGEKYTVLKDVILDRLLTAISSSKEERIIRASVYVLTSIISVNKSALADIKKKGLQLCDLASALKHNVHEAATLIYLINPSPTEIKTLELLPALVEVVCTSNTNMGKPTSLPMTPPAASLMIIEVLITAFDCATNNMHMAAITSPHVLCRLLDLGRSYNKNEYISLVKVLIKCMQFNGQCRKYVSQTISISPLQCLLQSHVEDAKLTAIEFFHEILHMPRSSAISLLRRMKKEGSTDMVQSLIHCVRNLQQNYQLLVANFVLQLETVENLSVKSVFIDTAMQIIFELLASENCSTAQQLSAFILANLGGTYSWTGEPYTVAWLVKKAGLSSLYHRNMIRNFDWMDPSLQDREVDWWCSKIAKGIISMGKPVFHALNKGLTSKTKKISRDSLTAIAWLGFEVAKCPKSIRYTACDILLNGIEQFMHPGLELEERLLACLCIYNYASGKGMQKLIHLSEGVRESLRRFSSVTWMAEELHRVADYYLRNKSRISCVHTQIMEASDSKSGSVTALIYYKGLLHSGYSDGSIKVWDIKQQSATLVCHMKEHKKTVTCFALFEAGDRLLSGSDDKTIRVWEMVYRKLECVEVVSMKEAVRKLQTYGQIIFAITQGHSMKVVDPQRTVKDICKAKKAKCMSVVRRKVYIGCTDSSIQELAIASNREREIRPPTKSWSMQSKPVNSIVVYKDWIYSASSNVEGSKVQDCRTYYNPQVSIAEVRNVLTMGVVEDFLYLNSSSSTSTLQIWLRATHQRVGRISAGSKITSLLTANDIIICGTEKGLIKVSSLNSDLDPVQFNNCSHFNSVSTQGWIPL